MPNKRATPQPNPKPSSPKLSKVFGPDGPLAAAVQGYEPRASQLAMAEAVQQAIKEQSTALIEAPTGTGKSLAYLIPALLAGKRAIIATANKSLQHQLHAKDIPLASQILGRPVDAVLVKGRQSYVCSYKWDRERVERRLLAAFDGEDEQVTQLSDWLHVTETGDVDELPIVLSPDLRPRVVSFTDDCIQAACEHFDDNCFVNHMRDAAASADLLITNHHLLLTALQLGEAGERILPPADIYVIDEAHHLVDTATAVFEVELTDHSVEALLSRRTYQEHVDADRLEELRFQSRQCFDALVLRGRQQGRGAWRLEEDLPEMKALGRELKDLSQTMQDLHPFKEGKAATQAAARAAADEAPFGDGDWPGESPPASSLRPKVSSPIKPGPSSRPGSSKSAQDEDPARARMYDLAVENLSSLADKLLSIASSRRDDSVVRYAEPVFGRRRVRLQLRAAPISPAEQLARHLFGAHRRAVICTSATLAAAEGFQHVVERFGVSRLGPELIAPPVFDYPSQALLYQPALRAYSWQAREAYYADVASEIERLIAVSRGRALCLFTSWTGLQQVRARLMGDAEQATTNDGETDQAGAAQDLAHDLRGPVWPIRAQGDAPRDALLAWFRDTPHSVLLATRSFWEGVDIPGEGLSLVVLDKLPFPSPTDPLHAARMGRIEEAEQSSFGGYTLPLMTLTLKQGFGRLVRRGSDRGVVAILDERLTSKGYGRKVRAALPPARFTRGFREVEGFFADALGKPADFALDLRSAALDADSVIALGLDEDPQVGEALDAGRPVVYWRYQLRRLADGRAEAEEGIDPTLADPVAGSFLAACLGLRNLAARVERAGREPSEFNVEIRAESGSAGWLEDAEQLPAESFQTEGEPQLEPADFSKERSRWAGVSILGLPAG